MANSNKRHYTKAFDVNYDNILRGAPIWSNDHVMMLEIIETLDKQDTLTEYWSNAGETLPTIR